MDGVGDWAHFCCRQAAFCAPVAESDQRRRGRRDVEVGRAERREAGALRDPARRQDLGKTKRTRVRIHKVKPGTTYRYCSLRGHEDQGMHTDITVR
jgi:hypothetical protein